MFGIFLDSETSGLDPRKHNILEIAFQICDLGSMYEVARYGSYVKVSDEDWKRSDPESLQINGIQYSSLVEASLATEIGKEIIDIFEGLKISRESAVFICQNPSFDRSFFSQLIPVYEQERRLYPYHWLDLASMHWQRSQYRNLGPPYPPRSKNLIAKEYGLPQEETPHRAMNGVKHLILCYKAVISC